MDRYSPDNGPTMDRCAYGVGAVMTNEYLTNI